MLELYVALLEVFFLHLLDGLFQALLLLVEIDEASAVFHALLLFQVIVELVAVLATERKELVLANLHTVDKLHRGEINEGVCKRSLDTYYIHSFLFLFKSGCCTNRHNEKQGSENFNEFHILIIYISNDKDNVSPPI